MPKRFTENDIWKKQRWFRKLKPDYKLAFFYIKDQCSHWGIWPVDCSDLIDDLGLDSFDFNQFLSDINTEYDKITGEKIKKERLVLYKANHLWITGFLQFQWEDKAGLLNPHTPAVRTALVSLDKCGLLDKSLSNGYIRVTKEYSKYKDLKEFINKGWQTLRERNRERRREEEKRKGKKFSEDKKFVFFDDETFQELGVEQRITAEKNNFSRPQDIIEGSIY